MFQRTHFEWGEGGENDPNETSENERTGIGQKRIPRSPKCHGDRETRREGGRRYGQRVMMTMTEKNEGGE